MKLESLEIIKFRSILKSKITFNKINAIVGENNAGKTAILRALNAFFNYRQEEAKFLDKTHRYAIRSTTKFIITLQVIQKHTELVSYIENERIKIEFNFNYSQNKRAIYVLKTNSKQSVDDKFIENLKKYMDFVYIPASRNNNDLEWSNGSVFSKLVGDYASMYTKNRDTISKNAQVSANKLHDTILTKVEKQIEELYMHDNNLKFELRYVEPIEYSIFLSKLGIYVIDNEVNHPIMECGSGIKSLTVISLYRALASLNNSNFILGIEEPETNLHPQAQKRLIDSLKKNMQSNEIQTIFATHSTVIVDELNHEDIILVRRENDERRGFKSKITQLSNTFWEDYNIEDFKHYQFFRYKNSDFFFSKYVILAESPIDSQVIRKLIIDELKSEIFDISILNLDGVTNLKYPFFLLKSLEIPFTVVVDKDFFVEYKNKKLEESRNDRTGLPQYAKEIREDNEVLNSIFNRQKDKNELINKIGGNSKILSVFLEKFNMCSMNYCLEMDLSCSEKAREIYYSRLNMMPNEKTQKDLLINKKNAIKKVDTILRILEEIPKSSYPRSFLRIKNTIVSNVLMYFDR